MPQRRGRPRAGRRQRQLDDAAVADHRPPERVRRSRASCCRAWSTWRSRRRRSGRPPVAPPRPHATTSAAGPGPSPCSTDRAGSRASRPAWPPPPCRSSRSRSRGRRSATSTSRARRPTSSGRPSAAARCEPAAGSTTSGSTATRPRRPAPSRRSPTSSGPSTSGPATTAPAASRPSPTSGSSCTCHAGPARSWCPPPWSTGGARRSCSSATTRPATCASAATTSWASRSDSTGRPVTRSTGSSSNWAVALGEAQEFYDRREYAASVAGAAARILRSVHLPRADGERGRYDPWLATMARMSSP